MMKPYLLIFTTTMIMFAFGFFIGNLAVSASKKGNKKKSKNKENLRIHCFECEIEMPVKEKNGQLFCTNCKLPH